MKKAIMAIGLTVHPPGGGDPTELTFDQQRVRIGRGSMCDLHLPHRAISSVHVMILLDGDRYFLVDPGSTNGSTLNGEVLVIERRKLLRSGDVIGLAGFEIVFRAGIGMLSYHSRDRTAVVARQLARQVMIKDGAELRSPALVVMAGPQAGQRFELSAQSGTMTIGRADDNDVVLDDREVSRHHVELDVTAEGVLARDVGEKNPLLINDQPTKRQRLKDRDELLIGSSRLVFDEPVEAYLRELAQWPDVPLSETSRERDQASAQDGGDRTDEADDTPGGGSASEKPTADSEGETIEDGDVEKCTDDVVRGGRVPEEERSPSEAPSEKGPIPRNQGMSTGTEIAVLFVGALALAVCIFVLVWIFH